MTTQTTSARQSGKRGISTRAKVDFLSSSRAYAHQVRKIEVKETHMSWVFLAGNRVYKLKKPVHYPFLDFSTLQAREADCREEDRLNRRLAPDVYLGVVPLTIDEKEELAISGDGQTVDWLVVMRRLHEDLLLDKAIAGGTATREQITAVADLLARFYADLESAEVTPEDYVAQFAREQALNRSVLTDGQFDLDGDRINSVLSAIELMLDDEPGLLMERAREGRIVDGHGDLRPEHVCLSDPPVIIDCLEFNRSLRLVDPFDELSFLAMECEHLGAPWIGEILFERCSDALGSRPDKRLIAFYTAYRAALRARLSAAHLLEEEIREPEKWVPQARAYLAIAERACLTLHPQAAR